VVEDELPVVEDEPPVAEDELPMEDDDKSSTEDEDKLPVEEEGELPVEEEDESLSPVKFVFGSSISPEPLFPLQPAKRNIDKTITVATHKSVRTLP
jgi:hypothetical protein